jgi:hypothetical protein
MSKILILSVLIIFLLPNISFAYIGPGIAIGSVLLSLGVVLFLIFLIVAIIYYPLKKIYLKYKKKK